MKLHWYDELIYALHSYAKKESIVWILGTPLNIRLQNIALCMRDRIGNQLSHIRQRTTILSLRLFGILSRNILSKRLYLRKIYMYRNWFSSGYSNAYANDRADWERKHTYIIWAPRTMCTCVSWPRSVHAPPAWLSDSRAPHSWTESRVETFVRGEGGKKIELKEISCISRSHQTSFLESCFHF